MQDNDKRQKKVSVVIATYRREKSLYNAILSVKKQTYPNIEIIVIDDNGDKEWNEKVENVVTEFEQLIYIKNSENKGSAETRNIGIRAATGEYITFLDDDDEYLPLKIEKQLKYMFLTDADYCITDLLLYDENGNLVDKRIRDYIKKTDKESLLKYHLMYHMTGTDTLMFKKEYLFKIGLFDAIDIGDEFYLMSKAICGGGVFSYLNECDIKAVVHIDEKGLSSGDAKMEGEKLLYLYKQSHFPMFDKKSIRYIKSRHYFVIAYMHLKNRKCIVCMYNLAKAVLISPIQSVKIYKRHKG